MAWTRICQECGHKQTDKEPKYGRKLNDAYVARKCKKCGSEALDYGSDPAKSDPDWYNDHEGA